MNIVNYYTNNYTMIVKNIIQNNYKEEVNYFKPEPYHGVET